MSLTLLPPPKIQLFDNSGNVLNGGLVYTYAAGTTTPKATYSDATGTTENANPVVLDSSGRATIFLSGSYKIVVKTSAGTTLYTVDSVSDVASLVEATSEWKPTGLTPTYLSATTFSVPGDQTTTLHVARRVRVICTAGTLYGTITGSSFAASITTVTVSMDSGSLDSGLSSVEYGFISYTNPAIRKVPIIDHGTKSTDFTLNMCLADVHIVAFSGAATLTIMSSLTSDKSTVIVKNGNNAITLAGIDNNSPTLTTAATKQDFFTVVKSFGKITCVALVLNEATT